MTRFLAAFLVLFVLLHAAQAQEMPRPDDRVIFDVAAEDWVITKTAHVTLNVEAAVSDKNAGTMRGDMVRAVNEAAKGDWRLTSFNRSQDQTGLERWSAMFEARLPEAELNGLGDSVKKVSKAGMQVLVGDINFSPSLEETEAARGALRTQLYKNINDQLTLVNTTLPGRSYRIATINFSGPGDEPLQMPMPRVVRGPANTMLASVAPSSSSASATAPMERAEKITLTAHVVFAALPDVKSADVKH